MSWAQGVKNIPALAKALAKHQGRVVMRPFEVFIIQMQTPAELRTMIQVIPHKLATDIIAELLRAPDMRYQREEYLAAIDDAVEYDMTAECPLGRAIGERPTRDYYVRAGINYFACYYGDTDTAIMQAYMNWTPDKHLAFMPRRVQRAVKTFLLVARRLTLGRDVCQRIVRTYVYADWLFMRHEYDTRTIDGTELRMEWGGGKKVSETRMRVELALARSTRALMCTTMGMGDTAMVPRGFRAHWALQRYDECARDLGLVVTDAVKTLDDFIAAIVDARAWESFYNACDVRTVNISDIALRLYTHMFNGSSVHAHWDDGDNDRYPLFWPLYDLLVRMSAAQKKSWSHVEQAGALGNDDTMYSMRMTLALRRGYGWVSNTSRARMWRNWWLHWSHVKHTADPGAFTLDFRLEVHVIYQLAPLYGHSVCATLARQLARVHYIANTRDPISRRTKKECVEYASHWRMTDIESSMGALEMQRVVGAHERLVALMRIK